jgi:hypothetical protein
VTRPGKGRGVVARPKHSELLDHLWDNRCTSPTKAGWHVGSYNEQVKCFACFSREVEAALRARALRRKAKHD